MPKALMRPTAAGTLKALLRENVHKEVREETMARTQMKSLPTTSRVSLKSTPSRICIVEQFRPIKHSDFSVDPDFPKH